MADSPALRAKRSRRHKAGDHRLCRSETCDAAGTPQRDAETDRDDTRDVPVTEPGTRGARLWRQMNEGAGLAPPQVVLLEEACRMADRLDQLDAMLADPRKSWLRLDLNDGGEISVIVDKLLSETRMQETALKGIVAELRQAAEVEGAGAPSNPTPSTTSGGGGNVVGIRSRIAEKRAQTAG
ncbi:hypothetical protein [Actinophytocola sp. NPDC049390]|uniref:hypothetical protein n=1 Tax=Actinophytocola sp. NPDC049390 TaxID=3363894 RepID=UPI0037B3B717